MELFLKTWIEGKHFTQKYSGRIILQETGSTYRTCRSSFEPIIPDM